MITCALCTVCDIFLYLLCICSDINIFPFRYLAVVTALTSEADYVFVPEMPPPRDWPNKLCGKLEQARYIYKLSCYISYW